MHGYAPARADFPRLSRRKNGCPCTGKLLALMPSSIIDQKASQLDVQASLWVALELEAHSRDLPSGLHGRPLNQPAVFLDQLFDSGLDDLAPDSGEVGPLLVGGFHRR